MWDIDLPDLETTLEFGRALGEVAPEGTIVALRGDLGAGKTSFSQGVGAGLSIMKPIVSPTFILMAEYEGGRLPLLHADAYRLKEGEAEAIGLEEAIDDWPGVALIEWADKILSLLPVERIQVDLVHHRDGRKAVVRPVGTQNEALVVAWKQRFHG